MIPSPVIDHVPDALGKLTSMFREKRNVRAMLSAYVRQVQLLEAAAWVVINARALDGSIGGIVLDALGALVGELRAGRSDADYRESIRLRILINRSTGRTPEVIAIIARSAGVNPWEYAESYPAGLFVTFGGTVAQVRALARALEECVPLGVDALAYYTTGPFGELFRPTWSGAPSVRPRGPSWTSSAPADGSARSVFAHVQQG